MAHRAGGELDPLTRLPNRREFLDQLAHALGDPDRSPGSVAVLFADLDGFRRVNRERGHGVGDELLFAAARRLVSAVGSADLVARAGGDEFVVMSAGLGSSSDVMALGNRILEAFDDPFDLDEEPFGCTLSLGVAVAIGPDSRPEALIADAEAALERSPRAARRFELFDAELRQRIRARSELGADFAAALRGRGVTLAYQPIVDIASGQVCSVEALARWRHPARGNVSPELFVAVSEETGSSDELLEAILEQAAGDFAAIAAADPSGQLSLAFNVSPNQLGSESLIRRVEALIERSGIDATRFVVEISEAALSGGASRYLRRVEELRGLGVRISLDDFGTASTSIAQLRSLPIDQLKLDRSFVAGLGEGTADAALAAGLLPMARALGIEVIAEGIETDQQLAHLFALGYRKGQGYRFAVAASAQDTAALIARGPLPAVSDREEGLDGELRERFKGALLAGDAKRAESIVAEAVAAGLGAMTIQTEIIGRSLHWIGSEGEAGRLEAVDEHLAAAICERQLATVFSALQARRRPPRFARRVLVAAIHGDGHDAELKTAADALDSAGYETVFLGTDVRSDALEIATSAHRPRAVCLTLFAPGGEEDLQAAVARLGEAAEPPLVLVDRAGVGGGIGDDARTFAVNSPQDALDVLAEDLAGAGPAFPP